MAALQELLQTAGPQEELAKELETRLDEFERTLKKEETRLYLSGKYDRANAILSIYAGAGGTEAQDWAAMLLRMYERFFERRGWKAELLEESFGEEAGIKSVTLEVRGRYAYGYLKGERGVHRLVRLSPFSAQHLRHTSFALVEVVPELSKNAEKEIELKPEELRVDTFRSSGPGGQNVNRRETAVRVTHLPTGIAVAVQTERSQGQNKERALAILKAKLLQRLEEEHKKEVSDLKGERVSAGWGNQIRSYVLHPYKMVKDLRTGVESSQPDTVLDGELEEFIEAELRQV